MIRAYYHGYGKLQDLKTGEIHEEVTNSFGDCFLLKSDEERLKVIGHANIYAVVIKDKAPYTNAFLFKDSKGNPFVFDVTTDKNEYIGDNNDFIKNALKIYSDDDCEYDDEPVPPNDIALAEKPLSERSEASYLLTIAAMLKYFDSNRLTQGMIAEWIDENEDLKKIHGLSASNLTKRFAKANDILNKKLKDK